jgi:hypothetical protein
MTSMLRNEQDYFDTGMGNFLVHANGARDARVHARPPAMSVVLHVLNVVVGDANARVHALTGRACFDFLRRELRSRFMTQRKPRKRPVARRAIRVSLNEYERATIGDTLRIARRQ